jgi:hypothetical protein
MLLSIDGLQVALLVECFLLKSTSSLVGSTLLVEVEEIDSLLKIQQGQVLLKFSTSHILQCIRDKNRIYLMKRISQTNVGHHK